MLHESKISVQGNSDWIGSKKINFSGLVYSLNNVIQSFSKISSILEWFKILKLGMWHSLTKLYKFPISSKDN